jgi:hypothetical protein
MSIERPCPDGSVTQADLAVVFDNLNPVTIDMLIGTWKVDPSYGETPGGKMLIESGWWGARFVDAETVDPLLYPEPDGNGVFAADLRSVLAVLSTGERDIPAMRREVETSAPIGRLRMVEYRGVPTATLVYDQVPVLDYLRAIDSDTIVAAVEHRDRVNQPDYALLRRCPEPG